MKKIFLICSILISAKLFAQDVNKADLIDCPPFTHPVLVNSCDGFRFHRPVLDCEHGFWFCSYGCTGWHWECWPDIGYKATLDEKNVAKIWAQLVGDKIEFHIPAAIALIDGYTKEELSVFNVDDELIFNFNNKRFKLLKGNYAVKEVSGELIIQVESKLL